MLALNWELHSKYSCVSRISPFHQIKTQFFGVEVENGVTGIIGGKSLYCYFGLHNTTINSPNSRTVAMILKERSFQDLEPCGI